jgi:hypothetical protein
MFSVRSAASKAKMKPPPPASRTTKLWCPGVCPAVHTAVTPGAISALPSVCRQSIRGSSKSTRKMPFSSGPGGLASKPYSSSARWMCTGTRPAKCFRPPAWS